MRWRWKWFLLVVVVMVAVVASWVLLAPGPKPLDPPPNSDQALRNLAQLEHPEGRLAALVILATRGDNDAGARVAKLVPGLDRGQLRTIQEQCFSRRGPTAVPRSGPSTCC
jgi:hypothetical protein